MAQSPSGMLISKDEYIIWHDRRSWISLIEIIIPSIVGLFFSFMIFLSIYFIDGMNPFGFFIFVLLPILILIPSLILAVYTTEYTITNQRIHSRYGIIARKTAQTQFSKVTDTSLIQSFLARILDYGNIGFNTAGSPRYEVYFKGVSNPKALIQQFDNISQTVEEKRSRTERIERLRDRLYTGEITQNQYNAACAQIQQEEENYSRQTNSFAYDSSQGQTKPQQYYVSQKEDDYWGIECAMCGVDEHNATIKKMPASSSKHAGEYICKSCYLKLKKL